MRRTIIVAATAFAAVVLLGGMMQATGLYASNDGGISGRAVLSQPRQQSAPGGVSTPAAAGTSITGANTPAAVAGAATAPNTGTGPGGDGISPALWIAIGAVGVVAVGLMSAGWLAARRRDD